MKLPGKRKTKLIKEVSTSLFIFLSFSCLFSFSIFSCANQSIADLKKHKDSYSKVDSSEAIVKVKSPEQNQDNKNPGNKNPKKKIDSKFSLSKIHQDKTDTTEVDSTIVLKGLIKGYKKFKRGLRITLSGPAIRKRMISAPNMNGTFVKETGDGFQLFNNVEELVFARKGADMLISQFGNSKFSGSPLELNLSIRALKAGKCSLNIKVDGLGKKTQTVSSSKVLYINRPGSNEYSKHASDKNWDKNYEQFQKRHNQDFLNDTLRRIHKQGQ